MSIRQFVPRRRLRQQFSISEALPLYFVFLVALLLQVSYPLLEGEALRLVTLAIVYWGAGAMLLHSYFSFGLKFALRFLSITFIYSTIVEQIGHRTGWPFGVYQYDSSLAYQIFDLPLVVPFAWVMMSYPILLVARRVAPRWVFLYGGLGLMVWDLFLDPQMVNAGRWSWQTDGATVPFQPMIPLSNAFGWLLTGMGLMALLHLALPRERRKRGLSSAIPDFFLLWTLFGGVIGNIFFFGYPAIGISVGIVFSLYLLPYFIMQRLGRSDF
jgi:putative membrane protein